jgi:hypothetical protein
LSYCSGGRGQLCHIGLNLSAFHLAAMLGIPLIVGLVLIVLP